jgi:hypothetical protein
MTAKPALVFAVADRLGRVAAVDTGRVLVKVEDAALMTRVGVGKLIGIRGATEQDYLIGIVDRITRTLGEEMRGDELGEVDTVLLAPTVDDALRAVLVGTYRTVFGGKRNHFKRGADYFPQIDRECFIIEGGNLQRFMGLLGAELPERERLALGRFAMDPDAVAVASGDRFFQRHASILGSTGSGKSWCVALLVERASKLPHPNLIVLDMHGEYTPLAKGPGAFAQGFRIAGPGDLASPGEDVVFLPFWALNHEEMLSMILDRSDQNAPNQASRFTLHVRELKEKSLEEGRHDDVRATFTVDSPVPYKINELIRRLESDDTEMVPGIGNKEKQGQWYGKLTRFISRLKAKMEDRRYGFMYKPPDAAFRYEWLAELMKRFMLSDTTNHGVKIIDFSEVPSDVLPVIVGVYARLLYDVQFWMSSDKRTPLAIICDEAHLYLPVKDDADAVERQALRAFERIAKEGRKYGVSIVAVSQRPSDVSRTILSQCNNFLVLRLTNDQDQAVVRRLVPDSMSGLADLLPLLDTGEALLLGDAVLLPTRIKLDPPSIKPASGTRDFWTEWSSIAPDAAAIAEAVETLRKQTRTPRVRA